MRESRVCSDKLSITPAGDAPHPTPCPLPLQGRGRVAHAHRDPWDRLIAAQAIVEGLTVVTKDAAIAVPAARVVW
jgi:hypothetical protein